MISDKAEKQIKDLIDDYGAPDELSKDIKDFLFESGNIYTIFEIFQQDIVNDLDGKIKKLLSFGRRISAIKLYRDSTGSTLRESLDYINNFKI